MGINGRSYRFLAAGMVELLRTAGYAPGSYPLAVGFAIPNDEIVPVRAETGEETLGVRDETRSVLLAHLKQATWSITQTDPAGAVEAWEFTIGLVVPQAQTVGTLLAFTRTVRGKPVGDLEGVTIIDIGGGDLQRIECLLNPYQLVSRRLGDGTIRIARALREKFPMLELRDVASQRALVTRRLMIASRTRDISAQVQEVIASQGQAILADLLPSLRQSHRFVIITDGGVILLHDLIAERLALEPKQLGDAALGTSELLKHEDGGTSPPGQHRAVLRVWLREAALCSRRFACGTRRVACGAGWSCPRPSEGRRKSTDGDLRLHGLRSRGGSQSISTADN